MSTTGLKRPAAELDTINQSKKCRYAVDEAAAARLQEKISKHVANGETAMLGMLVLRGGERVFEHTAGDAADGRPLTADTILRFYSMTKPIVSVAALMLIEEGKLQLSGKVSDYLSYWQDDKVKAFVAKGAELEPAKRAIYIHDLFCHTAGFTYGFFADFPEVQRLYREQAVELPHALTEHTEAKQPLCGSLREFAMRLNDLPLVAHPGSSFNYSESPDLLGCIIEEVTGASLGEFCKERIFKPLGMSSTSFTIAPADLSRLARCYRGIGEGQYKLADFAPHNISAIDESSPYLEGKIQGRAPSGGAGLLSTLNDYACFAECLASGGVYKDVELLRPQTFELLSEDHLPKIGAAHGDWLQYQGFGLIGGVVTSPATNTLLPSGAAAKGALGWGGAAGTFFWADRENQLACVLGQQMLDYALAVPTLRPDLCRAVYELFPDIQNTFEVKSGGRPSGFSG